MGQNGSRLLLGKVIFGGRIVLKTGLHIGGSKESMQIGGIDLPVIKDSSTNLPYIPGSSLKGKLRSSLEKFGKRKKDGITESLTSNRNIGTFRNKLFIHCCEDVRYALECEVCRIFGSSGDDEGLPRGQKAANFPALLTVRDCLLDSAFIDLPRVEVKTETGIDRSSMSANPRQVERVVPDTAFTFEMVYSVEGIALTGRNKVQFPETLSADLKNLLSAMSITESEGLGGYSSRGYGKVAFQFTEFTGRSLAFYTGLDKPKKDEGKKLEIDGFAIEDARKEIPGIVDFLKKESADALPG